jgi:hypothetical protein
MLGLVACVGQGAPPPKAPSSTSEEAALQEHLDEARRAASSRRDDRAREARESEQRANEELASTKEWEAKAAVERKAHADQCAADFPSRTAAAKLELAEIAFSHAPLMGLCQKIGATSFDEPGKLTPAQREFFRSRCQGWALNHLNGWYVWLDKSGDCADVDAPQLRITEVSFDDDVAAIRAINSEPPAAHTSTPPRQ